MPLGKRKRKLLLALAIALTGLLLLWISCPAWFPWVLRPLAAGFGAHFSTYNRQSYNRLILSQVAFTNADVRVQADRFECLVPTTWLWRCLHRHTAEPFLHATNWQVQIIPNPTPGTNAASVHTNFQEFHVILRQIQKWIPTAILANGSVRLPDLQIDVPLATWAGDKLVASADSPQIAELEKWRALPLFNLGLPTNAPAASPRPGATRVNLTAKFDNPDHWELDAQSAWLNLTNQIFLPTAVSNLTLHSTGSCWSNQLDLTARFARSGALPEQASLRVDHFHFEGASARLPQYADLNGSVDAAWDGTNFTLNLSVTANPESSSTNFPPVAVDLHASGNTNRAVIHALHLSTPWLQADLSRDATLFFTGRLVREPAALNVSSDLSKQRWFPLSGILNGAAQLSPTGGELPEIHFQLVGSEIDLQKILALSPSPAPLIAVALKTEGVFSWPVLDLAHADATFADGSVVGLQGRLDFDRQTVAAGRLDLNGALPGRWLPAGYSLENVRMTASFDGPIIALEHHGQLEVTNFSGPPFNSITLAADWTGNELSFSRLQITASAGASALSAIGSLKVSTDATWLGFQGLTLSRTNQPLLLLQRPATLTLTKSAETNLPSELKLESFDWRGPAGEVSLEAALVWPVSGSVQATFKDIRPGLLEDFLKAPAEPVELQRLTLTAGWTNGPLAFALEAAANLRPAASVQTTNLVARPPASTRDQLPPPIRDLPLSAAVNLYGDGRGLVVTNLVVNSQTSTVVMAKGFAPVTFNPADPTNRLHFVTGFPFEFAASTSPQSVLWDKLAAWTGLAMTQPDFHLNISGDWTAPKGVLQFEAHQVRFVKTESKVPAMDNLHLAVRFDRERAYIEDCRFELQAQPARVTGELPLGEKFWTGRAGLPDWKKAKGHLQIDHAQVAAFTPLLPDLLSPQGELTLDVSVQPGPSFDGRLEIAGARSRPLPNLGPIRDIELKMSFHESVLRVESASSRIGGAPLIASGEADLKNFNVLRPVIPPFKFALRGTNVPLSRQPESIIRSDLDLTLVKTNDLPAMLAGTAHLRDSYYLHDLADLVPGRVASPSRRPPYFSIENQPLADWRLAVRVTGERGLKIRSTLFNGEVSVNLDLHGTLKEPVALGDVRIDSGLVRFPFAALPVKQGFVTLTSQDPYSPQLLISAGSKQYGYDIKMDVSGPAEAPILQFSSTPPLSSEQIVLMVTAGELPRDMRSFTMQQRAQTLAVFVGRDLLTRLGFGDETEQRLTLRSGEEISEQGRPTYNVEYKLTDRWSLVGEYDRFNAFNAGLKWRIYSK